MRRRTPTTSEGMSTTFTFQAPIFQALILVAMLLMFMPIPEPGVFAQETPLTPSPLSMLPPDHSTHRDEPATHHDEPATHHDELATHHDEPVHEMSSPGQWEGSPEGIAYSEFNHALAGLGVMLVGFSELHAALGVVTLSWVRFLLPGGMLTFGLYLLIWSDHDAWPIGSLSFAETFSGQDLEILHHKILAMLLLGVGSIELSRRLGYLQDRKWSLTVPAFAKIGGLTLFLHMHGPHPQAHQIAMHHFLIGALAVGAASSRFVGEYVEKRPDQEEQKSRRGFMVMWSIFILFIGIQLILYSESPS